MYTCANCSVYSCDQPDHDRMPQNCPMRNDSVMKEAFEGYWDMKDFYVTASEMEAIGYCEWPRLREIIELCQRMPFDKIGIAFCKGLKKEAAVINRILKSYHLNVVSVICKTGGISKERVGIREECKLHPGEFEPMCNPIAQASLLNEQKTQFNIAVGLCVGHDSLFFQHSEAPVTVLIAKDRVLAHNPVGAVYCADGYFKKMFTPPEKT